MAGNPVLSALQAYGAYQDITRSNRADDLKEREFNLRERILKNQLLEQDEERELRDWSATKSLIASGQPNWWDFAPKRIVEQITSQVQTDPQYSYLRDPGARSTMIGAINTIKSGLGNPGTLNRADLYDSANVLFKPQLMRGLANDGQPALDKKIIGFYPADDGENMFVNLEVTRQDGSKYQAPLTQRRSADPDDPVKPVTVEQLFDSMLGTEAIINFVDSQMVRLGDKDTMKSIQSRAQGTALGHLLEKETALGDSAMSSAERKTRFLKSALGIGTPVDDAIKLSGAVAPSNREMLDQTEKGITVFRESLPFLRDDPRKWTGFAIHAQKMGVPAQLLGQDLSKLPPDEYNKALDRLEMNAAGIEKRMQWSTPRVENIQYGEQNIPTFVYPGGKRARVPGAGGPKFKPDGGTSADKVLKEIQAIDKELYLLGQKSGGDALLNDPKMQEAVAKNPQLKVLLSSGDDAAKEQYRDTLLRRREQLAPMVKQTAPAQQTGNIEGIARALAGKPPGRYRDRSGQIIRWDGTRVLE